MPKASRKTKRTKKRAVEIRYEPPVGISACATSSMVIVTGLNGVQVKETDSMFFRKDKLGQLINALVGLEKSLYYDKVINNACASSKK